MASIELDIQITLDTDGDGLPDDYELIQGFDPADSSDASLDLDGDNLSNLQEFLQGTNPRLADSDGDGLADDQEATH